MRFIPNDTPDPVFPTGYELALEITLQHTSDLKRSCTYIGYGADTRFSMWVPHARIYGFEQA